MTQGIGLSVSGGQSMGGGKHTVETGRDGQICLDRQSSLLK